MVLSAHFAPWRIIVWEDRQFVTVSLPLRRLALAWMSRFLPSREEEKGCGARRWWDVAPGRGRHRGSCLLCVGAVVRAVVGDGSETWHLRSFKVRIYVKRLAQALEGV